MLDATPVRADEATVALVVERHERHPVCSECTPNSLVADTDLIESGEEMLREPSINMTVHYGQGCSIVPDVFLEDLDVIRLAGFSVQMIHTPGHTKGSCCYYLKDEGVLFSGDTVFYGSVGRTDFPGGSTAEIVRSLHKLVDSLPEETEVFPGHDASTTIGYEKRYNPFV